MYVNLIYDAKTIRSDAKTRDGQHARDAGPGAAALRAGLRASGGSPGEGGDP